MPTDLVPIVHVHERYVVIDKPAGLLSVPGKGEANQDCVVSRLREMFPQAAGPMVVHRLDMDTSGLMIYALDADAQRELSDQFQKRSVEKKYVALVDGILASESGEIEQPIRADLTNRPVQIVDHEFGKPSRTRWKLVSIEVDRSRVELLPETGRTHQLRVHMASLGHPILGDVLYGPQPATAKSAPRLYLHASELAFFEPGRHEAIASRKMFKNNPEF